MPILIQEILINLLEDFFLDKNANKSTRVYGVLNKKNIDALQTN